MNRMPATYVLVRACVRAVLWGKLYATYVHAADKNGNVGSTHGSENTLLRTGEKTYVIKNLRDLESSNQCL